MTAAAEDVLDFWIGNPPVEAHEIDALMKRWFSTDPALDARIRTRFEPTMTAAAESALDDWAREPRGRLALILLLDQFPRNIYRGTPAAFAQDAQALELTTSGVAAQMHLRLDPLQRLFFYMPMQHAESLSIQERSVELFEELARDISSPILGRTLANSADFARQHRDIIAEFGRFPHRNGVLGRQSTEAEARYLEKGGKTFGQ